MDIGARKMIQIDKIAGMATSADSSGLATESILEWSRLQRYRSQMNRPALAVPSFTQLMSDSIQFAADVKSIGANLGSKPRDLLGELVLGVRVYICRVFHNIAKCEEALGEVISRDTHRQTDFSFFGPIAGWTT